MNKQDQENLMENFMISMMETFRGKIKDLPDNWDGYEIRHWIAQRFDSEDLLSRNRKGIETYKRARRRECENDIIVKNL